MSIPALLEMQDITKSFPGVKALDKVSFELQAGEIHALLGENGAGKSTLMKILSGVYTKDSGEIMLEGQPVVVDSPKKAQELGISIIHQELNLVPYLTVRENIYLGKEPGNSLGFVNEKVMYEQSQSILKMLGCNFSPNAQVATLSIGAQQLVEIAKALSNKTKVLIMDEPTAALTEREIENLFVIIRKLASEGVGIIYISHRMEELFSLSDRVTVMRDGSYIGTVKTRDTTFDELVKMMVGRDITSRFPKEKSACQDVALKVERLNRKNVLQDISFYVCAGEVVGVAGLMGSGRTELARAIFGADPIDSGTITVGDKVYKIKSPSDAIKAGIGLISEDRKGQGLILNMSIKENISLAAMKKICMYGFVKTKTEHTKIDEHIKNLNIRTPGRQQLVRNLSGGNQQKVVIAKWLSTFPKILIMDEPTRGVDVGAKAEIYQIMNMLTSAGVGILMISSELPEVLGMSDRVLVMHEGKITADMPVEEATQEKIMAYAAGGGD